MEKVEVIQALLDAKEAHKEYEQNFLGKEDEMWQVWYGAFLVGKLPLLGEPSEVTKALAKVSKKEFSEDEWAAAYADALAV